MEMKTIGAFIAALRKANGLTQRELAEKLNVSDKAVSRWERDEALPDLSLIPVLAEIFNVTCDELLKGQRIDPEAKIPEKAAAQKEKQIRNLLNSAKTKYQINSIISLGLGFMGILAALLINFGFLRSYIGFWAGCAFFVIAILCQIVFLIQAKARVESSDIPEDCSLSYSEYITNFSRRIFAIIIALFTFTLPLLESGDTYRGLTWDFWIPRGSVYVAIVCVVYWLRPIVSKYIQRRRNGLPLTDVEKFVLKRVLLILLIPIITWVAAFGISEIDQYRFIEAQTYDSWDAFKEMIETPTTPWGEPLTFLEYRTDEYDEFGNCITIGIFRMEDGSTYEIPLVGPKRILDANEETLCSYYHLNLSIRSVWPQTRDVPSRLPVFCYTKDAMEEIDQAFQTIIIAIMITGACTMLGVILQTAIAAKKLKHDET